jgi:hypothetical protein
MSLGNWFWLFVVLSLISWAYGAWQRQSPYAPFSFWPFIIPVIMLGYRVFGSAVH